MLQKIVNFFQKNGLIKILVVFVLLIISTIIIRNTGSLILMGIFNIVGFASIGYIVFTVLLLIVIGIVNAIKDIKK